LSLDDLLIDKVDFGSLIASKAGFQDTRAVVDYNWLIGDYHVRVHSVIIFFYLLLLSKQKLKGFRQLILLMILNA